MARKDDLTGKKTVTGHSKKHKRGSSGGGGVWRFKAQKTKRTWRPNLRKVQVKKNGVIETVKISMKTYKTLRNKGSYDGYELVTE